MMGMRERGFDFGWGENENGSWMMNTSFKKVIFILMKEIFHTNCQRSILSIQLC